MKLFSEISKHAEALTAPVKNAATQAINTARDQVESVAMGIENGYQRVTDQVQNTKESIANTAKLMAGTTLFIIDAGAVILPFVAPVPVVLGVAILTLFAHLLCVSVNDHASEGERKKAQRLAKVISRYGKIPETATVKTPYLDLSINSKTGEVAGKVRQAGNLWVDLGTLSDAELHSLKRNINCADSSALLEALLGLREASSGTK